MDISYVRRRQVTRGSSLRVIFKDCPTRKIISIKPLCCIEIKLKQQMIPIDITN